MSRNLDGFFRHIAACNTAVLPGGRLEFRLGAQPAGWVQPDLLPVLLRHGMTHAGNSVTLDDSARLEQIGEAMAREGVYRSHHELFDVWTDMDQPPVARIDRGALPLFGLMAAGVHLNGLVRRPDGLYLWIARRSMTKRLDPGKLDHLVAGGIPAGHTAAQALIKEAGEEASLPPELVARARPTADIRYALDRPEGLRRDVLHCFELELPPDFVPTPADGEVEEFRLIPLQEAYVLVRDTDEFKFNVNLVLIDLFLRTGMIDPATPEGQRLRRGLTGWHAPKTD
ncbi:thiamin pyrophosphokinase [Komagataeibacter europaeus NBRC 3261]|uniref:Thiamin pyrophosphokinase n=1 Tax=Komagataeibacter europaeus NBRC 3261 TaxID=1234669 RepID=A0A0D6PY63_KOMEU|nr:NUDIX domain-containing protein [Komagataeibacter europaeus]GAN95983.1 thiamin pyrophosphokinase [Komagataeibacter europaeus NBRC 3261]